MLCIRYSPGDGCEISGSLTELSEVAEAILYLSSSVSFLGDITQPPAPYLLMLSSLVVRVGSGPVCATVQGGVLCVTAAPEFLEAFSSFFQFDDTTPAGYHTHHEYFPGNTQIAEESVPLVITVHSQPVP